VGGGRERGWGLGERGGGEVWVWGGWGGFRGVGGGWWGLVWRGVAAEGVRSRRGYVFFLEGGALKPVPRILAPKFWYQTLNPTPTLEDIEP
jgi:hypothetical protein